MVFERFDWSKLLNKETRLYRHLVFWLLVILWPIVFKAYPKNLTTAEQICNILQLTLKLAIPGYINNYLVLPFFKNKKMAIGIILFIAEIVILAFLLPAILDLIRQLFVVLFNIKNWSNWNDGYLTYNIIAYLIMASIFKYAKDSLVYLKEQKETELRLLKSQLNPHFLFNTLNNLYGLAVNKSDRLPPLMLQLSELLRYSVYDTEHTFVPMEKELNYLKNYVEFEKIRLNENVTIDFNYSGDFSNINIAPLLLIVFIENGFKHFSYKRNEQGFININIDIHKNELRLNVKNSLDPLLYTEKISHKGIGLENVNKRLEMLYVDKYWLESAHQLNYYEVHLKIDLSK